MSQVLIVRSDDGREGRFECTWTVRDRVNDAGPQATAWQTVAMHFHEISTSADLVWLRERTSASLHAGMGDGNHYQLGEQELGSHSASRFLLDCLRSTATSHGHVSVACFVVPQNNGHIVRSDILSQRLLGCTLVQHVRDFITPLQRFHGSAPNTDTIAAIFEASIGAMLLKDSLGHKANDVNGNGAVSIDALLSNLDEELRSRLSFPWLSSQARPTKCPSLAIVDAGLRGPHEGGTGGSIYEAADALGIDMICFDSPVHWVNSPRYRQWRTDLVALECPLEPKPDFYKHIVQAVRSYKGHLDGILTFRDHYKPFVAKAAKQLGLPMYSPEAYEIATDKFRTSVSAGHKAYEATSPEQAIKRVQENDLAFPLIIKPCNGFLSEGVHRVDDISQLEFAVRAINTERHGREFVIEKYCEGPEVDANLVLCDGEVIFFEVSDDFPKTADVNGCGDVKTFIELANVLPTALPEAEQMMLRDDLRENLTRMGFTDGFYHIEARVENSASEYSTMNGVLDLRARTNVDQQPRSSPSIWLIEVNPRPPGIQAFEAVRHTYGVEYFGLALLFALEDKAQVRALSSAFTQGPQYWCEMVFIPVETGGTFDSGDVCEELCKRRPDLADHISGSFCFLKKGEKVSDPLASGVNSWVAYFNIFSRDSRADVLELADTVRQEVKFSIV